MSEFLARADVATELNINFTESTQPSSAEVDSIIDDIEADVKGVIRAARLAIPTSASNPVSFKIVRQIVLWGACSRCQAAYGGNVLGDNPREQMYWERYKESRNMILSNPRYLYDATQLSSSTDLDISGITSGDSCYHEVMHEMDDEY